MKPDVTGSFRRIHMVEEHIPLLLFSQLQIGSFLAAIYLKILNILQKETIFSVDLIGETNGNLRSYLIDIKMVRSEESHPQGGASSKEKASWA